MSKNKVSRKNNQNNNLNANSIQNKTNKKAKTKRFYIIITLVIIIVLGLIVVTIYDVNNEKSKKSELISNQWYSTTALNSSGDEVELAEIYNNNYSMYQGSLTFNKNGSFSLWLTPGDPTDGTHSGQYKVVDEKTIDVVFDNSTYSSFYINRENKKIKSISLKYNDYEIYFTHS